MLVLLPLLTALATSLACVLAAGRPRLQCFVSWAGLSALLVSAVALLFAVDDSTLRVALGNWPPPFGIEFAAAFLQQRHQRADACRLKAFDDDLVFR